MNRLLSPLGASVALLGAALLPGQAFAQPVHSGGTVNVVAYSTPGPVYGDTSTSGTLEYAFAHTTKGHGVSFNNSFAASDSQATAVANGLPADVVNFSYQPNMETLRQAGDVPASWSHNKYHGFVADSVVAFAVRSGNPKHISTWADLLKSGLQVVTPSTATSGGARWNIMAAYGAQIVAGNPKAKAKAYLGKLKKNIVDEPISASKSMAAFTAGEGDVLIGYEDDILSAIKSGASIKLVVPAESLLIQTPLSYTTGSASHDQTDAKAFVSFLYSNAAQTIWARNYYWPVVSKIAKKYKRLAPRPRKTLFRISKLGGWTSVNTRFFSSSGVWTKIDGGS